MDLRQLSEQINAVNADQQGTLRNLSRGVRDIQSTDEKNSKTLSKIKTGISDNKKMSGQIEKRINALSRQQAKMIKDNLTKIPTDLKDSLKLDRILMRDIFASVKNANEKLNRLGYTARSIKYRTDKDSASPNGGAPIVFNVGGGGSGITDAANITPLANIDNNLATIKSHLKTLLGVVEKNPLGGREKDEDFKALLEDLAREKRGYSGRDYGRNGRDGVGGGGSAALSTLLGGLAMITGLNWLRENGGAEGNLGLRGAKQLAGFLQPGTISKPMSAFSWAKDKIGKLKNPAADVATKVGSEVTEDGVKQVEKMVALVAEGGFKEGEKASAKIIEKSIAESLKIAGKKTAATAGKVVGKKIPILGLGIAAIFAADRAMDGDFRGAGLELASGIASIIPGIGTAASLLIDAFLIGRDLMKNSSALSDNMKHAVENTMKMATIAEKAAARYAETGSDEDRIKAEFAALKAKDTANKLAITTASGQFENDVQTKKSLPLKQLQAELSATEGINQENLVDMLYKNKTYQSLSQFEKDEVMNSALLSSIRANLEQSENERQIEKMQGANPDLKLHYEKEVKSQGQSEEETKYAKLVTKIAEYVKFFSKYSLGDPHRGTMGSKTELYGPDGAIIYDQAKLQYAIQLDQSINKIGINDRKLLEKQNSELYSVMRSIEQRSKMGTADATIRGEKDLHNIDVANEAISSLGKTKVQAKTVVPSFSSDKVPHQAETSKDLSTAYYSKKNPVTSSPTITTVNAPTSNTHNQKDVVFSGESMNGVLPWGVWKTAISPY